MIGETTREFVDNEVRPNLAGDGKARLGSRSRAGAKRAASLGLLGATIPEEYGGLGLDQTTGVVIAEMIGRAAVLARRSAHRRRSACCRSCISVPKN